MNVGAGALLHDPGASETEGRQIVARGFIRGVLWGAGVSLSAVSLFSVLGEGPQPPAVIANAPTSGSQEGGAPDEAARSGGDRLPVAGTYAAQAPAPKPDTLDSIVDTVVTSAAVPETGKPTDLQGVDVPQTDALSGISSPTTQAPQVAYASNGSLTTPSTEPGVSVSVEPAQPLAPAPATETSAFAAAPAQDERAAPAALAEIPEPATPELPEVVTSISDEPVQPDVPDVPVATGAFDTPRLAKPAEIAATEPPAEIETPPAEPASPNIEVVALAPEEAPVVPPQRTVLSDVSPQVTASVDVPAEVPGQFSAAPEVSAEPDAPTPAVASDLAAPEGADVNQIQGNSTDAQVRAEATVETPQPQEPVDKDVVIAATIAPPPQQQIADPLPEIEVVEAAQVSAAAQISTQPARLPEASKTVRVNRLPTLGTAEEGVEEVPASPVTVEVEAPTAQPTQRPVEVFAAPADNPDGKPMMAVVLLDDGLDFEAKTTGLSALAELPYPVSFAVDAMLPDAKSRMAAYRGAGFEVLAMIDLPTGATARDAEVNLSVALDAVPEAVGLLEGVETGVQTTPDAGRQVAQILAQTGHGLVTQNRGLNTVQKLAARQGVPSAVVFRDFDGKGQTATVIRRFMDQAAFRASQEGGVIMLGRLREETLSALALWTLQDRASTVAMVPVSAALNVQ